MGVVCVPARINSVLFACPVSTASAPATRIASAVAVQTNRVSTTTPKA